jgi:hypothetical protein
VLINSLLMFDKITRDTFTEIPRVPLIWTLIIGLLVTTTVITELVYGTATNVIVFFMVTLVLPIMIIVLSVVPLDKFFDVLGFDVGKWWHYIVYVLVGFLVGFGVFLLIAKPFASVLGLLPLPMGFVFYQSVLVDLSVPPILGIVGGIMYFSMVGISEEIMRKFLADSFSNKISKHFRKFDKLSVLLYGSLIGSLIWCASHIGSYSIAQSAPLSSYIMAYLIGMIFVIPCLLGILLKGTAFEFGEYVIIPAVIAHIVYDTLIFFNYALSIF